VSCPNCGSQKTERVFSIPYIEGETVAGSGKGKTEFPPINPEPSGGWVEEWVEGQEVEEAAERDGEYGEV